MRVLLLSGAIAKFEKYGDYGLGAPQMHPYGILSLAAVLEKNGYKDVKILDTELRDLSVNDVINEIRSFCPDIIGITTYTVAIRKVILLLQEIKKVFKDVILVAGGPHVTLYPYELIENEIVDYACTGEGESAFLELVQAIDSGIKTSAIANLVFKDGAKIVRNPDRPLIQNLDELPFPSFHLLKDDLGRYYPQPMSYRKRPIVTLITSRGCPFRCKFCSASSIWTRKWRFNSASYIFEMVKYLVNNFGIKEVCLFEDTFAVDKKRVLELCDLLIKEKLGIIWSASVNLRNIDEEVATKMKKSGCWLISCGIETGSDKVMRYINKPLTLTEAEQKTKMIHRSGIKIKGYFMLGHAIDTKQTIRETIEFSKKLPLYSANYSIFSPMPGSEFYDSIYSQYREENKPKDENCYTYATEGKEMAFVPDGLTTDYLIQIQKKAFMEFFIRPSQILMYFGNIRSLEDIKRFTIMFGAASILVYRTIRAYLRSKYFVRSGENNPVS